MLRYLLPIEPELSYPVCLKGKRVGPPEDCGGSWGYENLLAALQDPKHPDHEDMKEWVGDRPDSDTFDLEAANQWLDRLKQSAKRN